MLDRLRVNVNYGVVTVCRGAYGTRSFTIAAINSELHPTALASAA